MVVSIQLDFLICVSQILTTMVDMPAVHAPRRSHWICSMFPLSAPHNGICMPFFYYFILGVIMNYIEARKSVSKRLNIPDKLLTYIFHKRIEYFYKEIQIPHKSGKIRKINAPNDKLKSVQKEILKWFIEFFESEGLSTSFSHGFEKNKSIITNAKIHVNKKYVINLDLENFFNSFHFGRVRGYLSKNFNISIEEATVITNLICYNGVLPQGAPTSPIVANMICHYMDFKILKIAKKYKLNYTRYADDLTFSTNDKKMESDFDNFISDIEKIVNASGFKINEKKTRIQFRTNIQKVTGLVVNEKINVSNQYYKITRAMANSLYKTGKYNIDGKYGTINQLEGRFCFIDQLNFENNKKKGNKSVKHSVIHNTNTNRREKAYQEFLFYKYFYANDKPVILTEGKTDILYLEAALKNMYKDFPLLIEKVNNQFIFKVQFLKRSRKLGYFLGYTEGASGLDNIFKLYFDKKLNYFAKLEKKRIIGNQKPVFLLYDNEVINDRPLRNFLNTIKINESDKKIFTENNYHHIDKNLFLLTNQLIDDKQEMEIEDLFDDATLKTEIGKKTFDRNDKSDTSKTFGKARFAKYVLKNYNNINFENFKPMLQNISNIIENKI